MKAVVARGVRDFAVEEVSLDPPRAGEVEVRMAATGVCRSDLSVVEGALPFPFPIVLGHEGAGVVERAGEGVTHLAPGDPVVLSFIPVCGRCFFCRRGEAHLCVQGIPTGRMLDGTSRVRQGDRELYVMQFLGCMAERAVVPAACAVKIEGGIPLERAALVGCAVATGVGAALRTARVEAGASVAVFGCGGVGLCIVQGARLAGAARIVAIDVAPGKLDLARRLGASDTVDAREVEPVAAVRALTDGIGADYTFEAVGRPELVLQAWAAARRGGVVTVVGLAKLTETVSFNALLLAGEAKTLKGSVYGSANPHADFPTWLRLHAQGRLDLAALVTRTYRIEEATQAFADLERGANARGVIVFGA